jgi:hypothetical protein
VTVRELPRVRIGDKFYYQDDRLEEFRLISNPHDRITYKRFFKKRERRCEKHVDVSEI